MADYTIYTDRALDAELTGRLSMRELNGMTAKLNDREISKIRRELESRDLPTERQEDLWTGTFYVLSYVEPPLHVGVLHADPHCSSIDDHAAEAKRRAVVRVATPEEVAHQRGCKVCTARR